jgi:hypothetical protein
MAHGKLTMADTAVGIAAQEISAYMGGAARGDVLPIVMRLAASRANAAWTERATLVLAIGPACHPEALDTACAFMPRATEPLLLRAARSLSRANGSTTIADRRAWLTYAQNDLASASLLDPMDATVRVLLAEISGPRAWAYAA